MDALLSALQRTSAVGSVLAVQDGNLLPQQLLLELVEAAEAASKAPALALLSTDNRQLGAPVLKRSSLACVELPLVRDFAGLGHLVHWLTRLSRQSQGGPCLADELQHGSSSMATHRQQHLIMLCCAGPCWQAGPEQGHMRGPGRQQGQG